MNTRSNIRSNCSLTPIISYYFENSFFEKAIPDFNKAIELNLKYAFAYDGKAQACDELGRSEEALEAYKKFIQYASPEQSVDVELAKERIRQLSK